MEKLKAGLITTLSQLTSRAIPEEDDSSTMSKESFHLFMTLARLTSMASVFALNDKRLDAAVETVMATATTQSAPTAVREGGVTTSHLFQFQQLPCRSSNAS